MSAFAEKRFSGKTGFTSNILPNKILNGAGKQ